MSCKFSNMTTGDTYAFHDREFLCAECEELNCYTGLTKYVGHRTYGYSYDFFKLLVPVPCSGCGKNINHIGELCNEGGSWSIEEVMKPEEVKDANI